MGRRTEDLSGKRFGSLTVLWLGGRYQGGNLYWRCECDCGNYTNTMGINLKNGKSVSCGRCEASKRATERNYKHGGFGTRLYEIWRQMHRRCYGEGTKAYPLYGGRGITVCEQWKEYEPFMEWALANGYEDGLTIDRINVDGNYCPANCRWATPKEQSNNRRSNRKVSYKGETHTVSEWADIYMVDQRKLWQRLNTRNWDLEAALISLGVM